MKKQAFAIALAGATLFGLSACGSATAPSNPPSTAPSDEQPTDAPMDVDESMGDEEGIPESELGVQGARSTENGVATFAFGDEGTFENGAGLQISYVEETTLSEYGAGDCAAGDPVSIFKVTVKNGTGAMWEPYLDLMVAGAYTEDESGEMVEASDVFDDYGAKSLDAGQSLPRLQNEQSGSSYWGFCHAGGSAESMSVYGSFMDEYGESAGEALWVSADSIS